MSLIPKLRLWFSSIDKAVAIRRTKPEPERSDSPPTSTIPSTISHFGPTSDDDHPVTISVARINPTRRNDSAGPKIVEHATTALSLLSPAVGVVPIAEAPLKSAIGGLLEVLKICDAMDQNKKDIAQLRVELDRLSSQISAISAARSSSITALRDDLTEKLNGTTELLRELGSCSKLRYMAISKGLLQCSKDIDRFLSIYQTLSNMHLENSVEELHQDTQRSFEQLFAKQEEMQMFMAVAMGFIRLVDAIGRVHHIPMALAGSLEQFNLALNAWFFRDTVEDRVLYECVQRGPDAYDLCIDSGRQVIQLTSQQDGWPEVYAGTTIVMRAIGHRYAGLMMGGYRCPRPGCNMQNNECAEDLSVDWYPALTYYSMVTDFSIVRDVMLGFRLGGRGEVFHLAAAQVN